MQWIKDGQEKPKTWPYTVKDRHCAATLKVDLINKGEIINTCTARNEVYTDENEAKGSTIIDISAYAEKEWDKIRLELDFEIKGGASTLADAVTINNSPEAYFSARIHAPRAKFRQQKWGNAASLTTDRMVIEIAKDDIGGELYIWPEVLLKNHVEAVSNKAFRAGSRIIIGDPMVIAVDDAPQVPGAGFDIKWLEFDKKKAEALYELEFENAETGRPRLYFNNKHVLIAPIIDSHGRIGMKARLRDVIFSSVATEVWSELIEWAAERDDEDETASGIHNNILKAASKSINLNKDDIKTHIKSAEGRRNVQLALQHAFNMSEKISKAAEVVSSEGE